MNYLKVLFIPLLVFALYIGTAGIDTVLADKDEKYERYEEHGENQLEELFEELGEFLGWTATVALGVAGMIFPIRRLTKSVITHFPSFKTIYISIAKFLGKYHISIGILALNLTIIHGITMLISEGELDDDGVIGLVSFIFMVIASIVGAVLFKNKKIKRVRTTHTTVIVITLFTVVLHVFVS